VDEVHTLTFTNVTAPLRTHSGEPLYLSFRQTYSIERGALWGHKIRTRLYMYAVEDAEHNEIIAFHWHPEAAGAIDFPHLHVCSGAGRIRDEFYRMHIRTDRFAFEEFADLLIRDFGVRPERGDAADILRANLQKFRAHRSWPLYRS
jgi:hypothetical protein